MATYLETRRVDLVIFDIDGTLVRSDGRDDACYVRALSEATAVVDVDTDWSGYQRVTEPGIAEEVIRAHKGAVATGDVAAVEERFVALLQEAVAVDERAFVAVDGAADVLLALAGAPRVAVAIATGCWRRSARVKLDASGLPLGDVPVATGDDAGSKEEIMKLAARMARTAGAACSTRPNSSPACIRCVPTRSASAARTRGPRSSCAWMRRNEDLPPVEPSACAVLFGHTLAHFGAFGGGEARDCRPCGPCR